MLSMPFAILGLVVLQPITAKIRTHKLAKKKHKLINLLAYSLVSHVPLAFFLQNIQEIFLVFMVFLV